MPEYLSLSRYLKWCAVVGFYALMTACSPGDKAPKQVEDQGGSRFSEVAQQFTQRLLLPGFAEHAAATSTLLQAVTEQCSSDVIDELVLQTAWTKAFLSWQKTNFLLFGPLTEERALRLQFYPDKRQLVPARVQQFLQNPASISAEKIATGTAPTQGYPALEQLIFAVQGKATGRCELLSAVSAFVVTQAEQLSNDWQSQADDFASNGEEAVGRVVDSLQRAASRLHERRIAVPLGLGNSGERQPEPAAAEAAAAKQSLPAILATVESLQQWLTGPGGLRGLANDEATQEYFAELENTVTLVIAAVRAETLPLADAVVNQPEGLLALHAGSLSRLKTQLSELNTVLKVYTGFNADDGD